MKYNNNIKNQSPAYRLNRPLSFQTTLAVLAFLLLPQFHVTVVAQEESEQLLNPELEMKIIRSLNKEDRQANRQVFLLKNTEGQNGGEDVSGEWLIFTTMFMNSTTGEGIMYVKLEQDGEEISGINGQLKHPFDPPATIRTIDDRTTRGVIKGKWYPGRRTNMMVFERQGTSTNPNMPANQTWAIFTAMIAADGRTAVGQIVNHGGYYGTMLIVKREALADYQHLLTEEGQQAEDAKRLKGIEQMEAGIEADRLLFAVNYWWKLDKDKDGSVSYEEFPHPDWHRANLDGDEFLTWREELTDIAMRRVSRQGGYREKYATSSKKEWSSWHDWGSERPDFEWLFPFIDRNRHGKISASEYTAFEDQVKTYIEKSWPNRNEWGQTGLEVLRGGSSGPVKTSWDSLEEWKQYKGPKMAWVFSFVDKNDDGKIDNGEHQAFEDYKEKHADWKNRARKKLGMEAPQDN